MDEYKLFIDGEFVDAADGQTFETIDPGTGLPFATVAKAGNADAEAAIAAAKRAFDSGIWSGLPLAERVAKLQDFADQISQQGVRMVMTECMDAGQIVAYATMIATWASLLMRNLATHSRRVANSSSGSRSACAWESYLGTSQPLWQCGRSRPR